jgi:Chlorophyllase enzyme
MRTGWIVSLVALTASARPLWERQNPKVEPNEINVLGGDFGLADTRLKVELYDMLAKWLSSPATGPSAKESLISAIGSLVKQGGLTDTYQGFGGDGIIDWLSSQFAYWMLGTDSDDMNTVICRAFESESKLSFLWTGILGVVARPGETCERDYSGGSGPYKANYTIDQTLPSRTIFAPLQPPKNISMPVIAWGGGCLASGVMYSNFLTEIASHGYLIITTGLPNNSMVGTTVSDMTRNIDWVMNSSAANKYGNIDRTKIIAAGHSCGGLEALSGTYRDPRVMLTMLFNSGISNPGTREKLKLLNRPVAYFEGAPKLDFAWGNVCSS